MLAETEGISDSVHLVTELDIQYVVKAAELRREECRNGAGYTKQRCALLFERQKHTAQSEHSTWQPLHAVTRPARENEHSSRCRNCPEAG